MKGITLKIAASAVLGVLLNGCMTNDQGQTVLDPNKVNMFIGSVLTPQGQGDDGEGDDDAGYDPAPNDQYVANVQESDVIVEGGNTYVMATDPHGRRHRVLYGHGDMRAQVMARHEQLQRVVAHNGGALPTHAIAPTRHGSGPQNALAGNNSANSKQSAGMHPAATQMHGAGAPAGHVSTISPAKSPAPAPVKKDPKKAT